MILSYTTTFHMSSYGFSFMTKIVVFKRKTNQKYGALVTAIVFFSSQGQVQSRIFCWLSFHLIISGISNRENKNISENCCVHLTRFVWMGICNQLHLAPTYCFSSAPAACPEPNRIFFILMLCLKYFPCLIHFPSLFNCNSSFSLLDLCLQISFSLCHYLSSVNILLTSELKVLLRFHLK